MSGGGPRAGWRETIGARIAAVEAGRVTVEVDANARHRHEGGVVQGGVITQIADAAMGMALMTVQPDAMANVTVELKMNFIRPVVEGMTRAVGWVVDASGDVLFAEADVFDAGRRLVARGSCSCVPVPQRGWR
jgi:uncharacterized protein (TIGR00369 family)